MSVRMNAGGEKTALKVCGELESRVSSLARRLPWNGCPMIDCRWISSWWMGISPQICSANRGLKESVRVGRKSYIGIVPKTMRIVIIAHRQNSRLSIFQSKGKPGCPECQRRQLVAWEKRSLVSVVAGLQLPASDNCMVNDDDIGAAFVLAPADHITQAGDLDFQTGFLQALAPGCLRGVFIRVHKSSRKAPLSNLRRIQPAHKQHLPVLFDKHPRGNLGIIEMDKAALRASRPDFSKKNLRFKLAAA